MYHLTNSSNGQSTRPLHAVAAILVALVMTSTLSAQGKFGNSIVTKVAGAGDKIELTTNSSRILTIDKRIPRVQVNNPELLSVTPLSATQVQVSAKKAGVTQVNLWDEDNNIHTVDVYIYGDVRELQHALKTQFPNSSVKVYRYSNSLVLTGFIDRPDYVDPIYELASDYAPKVINNINVGGVQQVLLKVKIYEISRTRLRELGVDWAHVSSSGAFIGTSISGLLSNVNVVDGVTTLVDTGGQTVEFAVTNGSNVLTGWLDAVEQNNIAKILAEPNLVTVSGRPAQFNEGGEIPVLIPQSLGQIAVEYKPYGTQVDFLPIVLGNGKIRLEVRPRISDIDDSRSVTINDINIPALTVRQVDTAVEMNAGQTLAIAGLIQQRTETVKRGLPYLADIPILGVPFRRVGDDVNEIELLVMVTPELVDAMDPHEVPPCAPGMGTISPDDCDLYINGKMEIPDNCNACRNYQCHPCECGGFASQPPSFVNGVGAQQGMGANSSCSTCNQGHDASYQVLPPGVPTMASPKMTNPEMVEPQSLETTPEAANELPLIEPSALPEPVSKKNEGPYLPKVTPSYVNQPIKNYQSSKKSYEETATRNAFVGPVGYDLD